MIESYFATIPSAHRALILAGGITLFWLIESGIPLFSFKGNKWAHAKLNLFFTFTTIAINFPFAILLVAASDWTSSANFGILHWVAMPSWAFLLVGLLLMDGWMDGGGGLDGRMGDGWMDGWVDQRMDWCKD